MDKKLEKDLLERSGLVRIDDGTTWPDPTDEITHTAMWRMIHAPESMTYADRSRVLRMAEAYDMLVTHSALTLKEVQRRVSSVRKAIKS